jgi:hypothetical protein
MQGRTRPMAHRSARRDRGARAEYRLAHEPFDGSRQHQTPGARLPKRGKDERIAWQERHAASRAIAEAFDRSIAGEMPARVTRASWPPSARNTRKRRPRSRPARPRKWRLRSSMPPPPDGRRLGGPDRIQPDPDLQTDDGPSRREIQGPLHPLRHPRTRHGGGDERYRAAWRLHSLWRHLPGVLRLRARRHAPVGADGQRVIYVLTHDSIGLGEDGPTHQPVEHLAMLRATPNMNVFRPADIIETAECWELALDRTGTTPSVLALSRQGLPMLRSGHCTPANLLGARAPMCCGNRSGPRDVTLIATGSEVEIAKQARPIKLLARIHGIPRCGGFDALLGKVRGPGAGLPGLGPGRCAAHRHRGGRAGSDGTAGSALTAHSSAWMVSALRRRPAIFTNISASPQITSPQLANWKLTGGTVHERAPRRSLRGDSAGALRHLSNGRDGRSCHGPFAHSRRTRRTGRGDRRP